MGQFLFYSVVFSSVASPLRKYFRVHLLWKQSISKETNNDNNFEYT
jgi:hypothetical protein